MIILSDFDGTISKEDTCDYYIKKKYNISIETLKEYPHNYFYKYFTNSKDVLDVVKEIEIDPYFNMFHKECISNSITLKIISSGFKQVINYFIKDIEIIANDLHNINYEYKKNHPPNFIYIGDGRSDFEISHQAEFVFAKINSPLLQYCIYNDIEHISFRDFSDIHKFIFNHKLPYKLFSPGVVRSPPNVLESLTYQHTFMHRNKEFHDIYKQIDNDIKKMLSDDFTTLLVTGSGTTSMDEVISSQVLNFNTLIISNGLFGERWQEIGEYYGKIHKIKKRWGESLDTDEIVNYVKKNKIESVIMVHCDTSTGILNNIDEIGDKLNINFIVDCVSTFGSIPVNPNNKDIIVFNPNKGLASHMGVGIVMVRDNIIQKIKNKKCGGYSLNLYRHYQYAKKYETCNTVCIASVYSLMINLKSFKVNNTKHFYNLLYDGIKYDKLLPKDVSSPCVLTILLPNSNNLIKYLKERYFIVYECKGDLYNKAFQISLFGYDVNEKNINKLIYLINGFTEV